MRTTPLLSSAAATLAALSLLGPGTAQHWRSISPPAQRSDHAVAFDTWRNQTVMYGGRSPANNGLEDTWVFDGADWHGVPTSTSPGRRLHHAMAFDALRGVTVLFGGQHPNGTRLGDTWEFDGTTWTQIPIPTPAPSPRTETAMVYVPGVGVVLFGGLDGSYRDDTWVYDGTGWSQQAISAPLPPARYGHAMAHDAQRGVTVLFGGYSLTGRVGDTWELDLAATPPTWTQIPLTAPNAPGARYGHCMTYDSCSNVTVLFGGIDTTFLGNCWTYDGTAWTLLTSPTTAPSARYSAAMTFDTRLCRAVLFGGQTSTGTTGDTWLLAAATAAWNQIPLATAPTPRIASVVFDGARHRFVMFGGMRALSTGRTFFNDTWELAADWSWTQVPTANAPSPRVGPGMVYDTRRGRTVLFGGGIWIGSSTWEYFGGNWTQIPLTAPNAPSPRAMPAMAFDLRRGRTVLFGGAYMTLVGPAPTILGDTWEYDGTNWMQVPLTSPNAPSPRYSAAVTYDARRGVMVLFGGAAGSCCPWTYLDETWEYNGVSWTQIQPTNVPSARVASLAYDPARGACVLNGGFGTNGLLDETWEYDGANWTQLAIPGPSERGNNTMVHDPDHGQTLMFWGNNGGGANNDDAWAFVPATAARWTSYGFGCAGSNGTPVLTNATLPQLGMVLRLDVGNLPATGGFVFLAHGFDLTATGGTALPIGVPALPGCRLWIDPLFADGQLHTGGPVSFTLPIPSDPALAGTFFSSQALAVDFAAPNGLGALSNAGIGTVN